MLNPTTFLVVLVVFAAAMAALGAGLYRRRRLRGCCGGTRAVQEEPGFQDERGSTGCDVCGDEGEPDARHAGRAESAEQPAAPRPGEPTIR